MKLTLNQEHVLQFLSEHPKAWFGPAKIGLKVGGIPSPRWGRGGTDWAVRICEALIKKGLVERNAKGQYRIRKER